MFYRELFKELNNWKLKTDRKSLVLRGARQVGKTTLVEEFAKTYHYKILLNLEKKEHKQFFENEQPFQEKVNGLLFHFNISNNHKPVLLFLDEIQNSPTTISLLRYFYEEAPWIHVISAGSLLESLIDRNISFPVGRVEYLSLRPCSFFEFVGAIKEKLSLDILQNWPIPDYAHNKLITLFNKFTLLGGMPEIIEKYVLFNDLVRLKSIYDSIIVSFIDDIEKYARNFSQVQQIRHIIKAGMGFAGERIKFEKFGNSDYRSREMGEAFRVLEKAMLIELIYPITIPKLPLLPDYKKSPKLIWFDTGLVNFNAGMQTQIIRSENIMDVWRGKIAEHITAQELITNNTSVRTQRNFWVRESKNSNAEVDYIMQIEGLIIPIEIKSGKSGRLRSLHQFMELAPHHFAIKVSSAPFGVEEASTLKNKTFRLINIPFYLTSKIPEIIKKYI